MKKSYLLIYILFLVFITQAQINSKGYPFYTYFNSKDFNAYDQNWDIVEDGNGIIYVANNVDGVLQYDGESWRKISIENDPAVRSLAISDDGIIYVGCYKDFGCIIPDVQGNMTYSSFIDKIDMEKWGFALIYNVNIIEDTVFFSTENSILIKYLRKEDTVVVSKLPEQTLFTFNLNNRLHGACYTNGLYANSKDSVKTVLGGEFYKSKNIFAILPDTNISYIVTGQKGIFSYNNFDGNSMQMLTPNANNYLSNFISYAATRADDNILLATLGSGVVECNSNGEITSVLDQQIGIEDHVCASVNSYRNSVWCALGLGIVRFEYTSPFRTFSKESKLEGYIRNIVEFKNNLFVATELGLFYLNEGKNEPSTFVKIEGIEGMIVSMQKMVVDNSKEKEFLIIGTDHGIYKLNNRTDKIQRIDKNLRGIEKLRDVGLREIRPYLLLPEFNTGRLWVCTIKQLICLSYENHKWNVSDSIYNLNDQVENIIEDVDGDVWVATIQSGIIKIDNTNGELSKFDMDSDLPTLNDLRLFENEGVLLCGTPEGLYQFEPEIEMFIKDTLFPKKFTNGSYSWQRMLKGKKGEFYINYYNDSEKGVDKLIWNNKERKFEFCDDFKRIGNVEVNCFYESEESIWFGVSNVLYNYNNSVQMNISIPYSCLVRKVEGADSIYFLGTFYTEAEFGLFPCDVQEEHQKPIVNYSGNDLVFHFAAPYFEGNEAIDYSYKLIGFKKDWSKWNNEPKAVFTNLNEGKYTFQVKAKNIYDIESSVGEYSFTILPPWYRTVLAYLFYVICLLFVIWIILKLYTRRLKREKIRLEGIVRERTAEIREQRDEIAEQKKSIEDSIQYASRIQRAILPSEELAEDILPEHFILFRPRDIVSGDYYWMNKIGNKTIIVAADCTGHGVPGAFMSMLGVSFLNAIVLKEQINEPHIILNKLRERVKKTLKQEGKEGEAKDGMDIALVVIDETKKKLYFAGAYNPVLIFRKDEMHEIKADRMPIGIYIREKESFTLSEFEYQTGDTFYIFSDGYPDQFGGEKGQKFRIKTMKQLLADIQNKSMAEQKEILNKTILDWMGCDHEQIDDMVIVGVRL